MAIDNVSNGSSGKKADQQNNVQSGADEKRKTLQQNVMNEFKPKIDLLKSGKEKVQKYAEKEKEAKVNSAVAEYESTIKSIEEKYSKEKNEPKENEIKKILESVETLSLSEEEKKKITEALDISFEDVIANKKAEKSKKQKDVELDSANKKLEEAKRNAEEWYNSFVNRYDSIFEDRIKKSESQIEKLVNGINSADPITLETMYANSDKCKQNETKKEGNDVIEKEKEAKTEKNSTKGTVEFTASEPNKTKNDSIRNDLAKLVGLIVIPVVGIGGALLLHNINKDVQNKNSAIEHKTMQSNSKVIENKNSTIYIETLPISTQTIAAGENMKMEVKPSSSTQNIEGKQIKATPDHKVVASTSTIKVIPPSPQDKKIESKVKNKVKDIIVKKKEEKRIESPFQRAIENLKNKAEKLGYDGIPVFKGSSKSHILSFIEEIEKMNKEGKLSTKQKTGLETLLHRIGKSLDLYLMASNRYKDNLPKEIKAIKKDIVKYIKWLRSQGFNEDAIEYLTKQWSKSIYLKHKRSVK